MLQDLKALSFPLGFYPILVQANPEAATSTLAYEVPEGKVTLLYGIIVCNRDNSSHNFRVSISKEYADLDDSHYLYKGTQISANDTLFIEFAKGILLEAQTLLRLYVDAKQLTFTILGIEEDLNASP